MSDFVWSPVGTAARLRELEAERDNACELVAQMHHAATGYMQGPIRGVVEDIADLKTERDQLRAEIERLRTLLRYFRVRLDPSVWEDECAEIDDALKEVSDE